MAEPVPPGGGSLRDWLRFLGTEDCPCEYGWRECIGILYGQNQGPGWVRITTDPDCPHHGKDT